MQQQKYDCPKCGKKTLVKMAKTAGGKIRWGCRSGGDGRGYCYSTTTPEVPYVKDQNSHRVRPKKITFKRSFGNQKRFVVTSAQNATPLHEGFWNALKSYCSTNGAELIVIPIRYKNPTSKWTESQQGAEFWHVPDNVLYNQRKKLGPNLVLLGDIKTIPTAVTPLSGFEGVSHGESCIIGHPKLQLSTIPTPHNKLPKILTTTGACTVANYTDSKAGKKGEFHHTLGACVVELDGKRFHMRQINACKDGSFIDINIEYLPDGSQRSAGPAGLVMGDTHVRFADPRVIEATLGPDGIADTFNVDTLVWHDLLDGYAVNPHHKDDPFIKLAKHKSGYDNMRGEVEEAVEFLRLHSINRKSIVVASNHDDFLNRWMRRNDWREDPVNAEFYLETAKMMANNTIMGQVGAVSPDPFSYWVNRLISEKDNIHCLKPDESFMLGNIECGFHGHRGPNGARGSINNLSKLGVRVMSGHGHSPGIVEGHTRVGTSTRLTAEYASGPSSWLNSHGIVYANSKRTLVNIIDGKWRP